MLGALITAFAVGMAYQARDRESNEPDELRLTRHAHLIASFAESALDRENAIDDHFSALTLALPRAHPGASFAYALEDSEGRRVGWTGGQYLDSEEWGRLLRSEATQLAFHAGLPRGMSHAGLGGAIGVAPVRYPDGRVHGVVLMFEPQDDAAKFFNGWVIALLTGISLSLLIARLVTAGLYRSRLRSLKQWQRLEQASSTLALEVTLLVAVVFGVACWIILEGQEATYDSQITATMEHLGTIQTLYHLIDQRSLGGMPLPSESLGSITRQLGNESLEKLLERYLVSPDPVTLRTVQAALTSEFSTNYERLAQDQAHRDQRAQLRGIVGWLLLASLAFGLLALRKQRYYNGLLLDRVEGDQKQRHSRAQLLQNLPVGVCTLKADQVTFSNQTWDRIFHRRRGESASDALWRAIHPADQDGFFGALEKAAQGQAFLERFRIVLEDGETRHLEARAHPVHDQAGGVEHLAAYFVDQTQSLLDQHALRQKNAEFSATNELLNAALSEVETSLEMMVRTLVRAVEAKDPYTAGHSERVMRYAVEMGRELGLGPYEIRILELGCLIHDIGKIGIPDRILTKADRLTEDEYQVIKLHPVIGANMVDGIEMFQDCLPIVRSHHERLDGSGYPDGLQAHQINELVQIAAVADMFDAMTSERSYRGAMSMVRVLNILDAEVEAGKISGEILKALKRVLDRQGEILGPDWYRPVA